jgi:hypothetical protein
MERLYSLVWVVEKGAVNPDLVSTPQLRVLIHKLFTLIS